MKKLKEACMMDTTPVSATEFFPLSSLFSNVDMGLADDPRYTVFPGFCDVHVHFREPGFSYKETVASGSASAARGGYTAVCTMANLNPVPDSVEHLEINTCARMSLLLRRSPTEGHLTEKSQAMMKKIEGCLECGQCRKRCPFGLDTPNLLKRNYEDYKTFLV